MKQVKLFILVCSFLSTFTLMSSSSFAQDSSKYHGGSYDGFSNGNISQTTLNGSSLNTDKYFGGSYDGFSLNNISQTSLNGTSVNLAKYFGGSYDGFSLNNISQSSLNGTSNNLAKFFGGSYDGFSLNNISQSSLNGNTIDLAKYFGGSYDGFSLNTISQTSLGGSNINLAKYFGGSYDGFGVAYISSVSLPVVISSFTSSVTKNNVNLKWTTEIEINNSGFKIERLKLGGNNWTELSFVHGYGTTNEEKRYSFDDRKLQTSTYKYRLKQIDFNGNYEYFTLEEDVVVGIPKDFKVSQNYPNPSNPKSKIDYEISVTGKVTIKLFDILGREVIQIVNDVKEAGYYTAEFDGSNLSSGVYFYVISVSTPRGGESLNATMFKDSKKMVLIK